MATKPRTVQIEIDKYQKYLDDPNLTNTQRTQLLEALWIILTSFIDLGFRIENRAKDETKKLEQIQQNMLESIQSQTIKAPKIAF